VKAVACYIVVLLLSSLSVKSQQFYIRGEIKDELGNVLQNVAILQHKTGYIFKSGSSGTFGIISNHKIDTFSFSRDGYYTERMVINADNYTNVKLRFLPASSANSKRDKLSSITLNLEKDEQRKWFAGDETYASLIENRFVNAQNSPSTGISLNIDRASYSNIRRFITQNTFVPPDAVRIEEMLNYFNLAYQPPEGEKIFNVQTTLSPCPWNKENQLYYINLSAKKINLDSLPPSHLVFLIDVSGSMDMPNRLPLLKSAFKLLVNNLREKDSVSIVVYGGITGVMLNTTSGIEKDTILKAIDALIPGGTTPGESGVKLAYSVARNHFIKGGNNRVILATDGDFNVGLKTEDELDELISQSKLSGVYLTCLGVGMGNYKDSKIQTLAKKGNGNFAYLDTYKEAEKVLLQEFTQTLYAVADDVYMNVSFNPDYVKEYRLLGFDNKVGALKDSLSVIEGGEIGSGHSMLALFEISPTNKNLLTASSKRGAEKLTEIKLQYRLPNNEKIYTTDFIGNYQFTPLAELNKGNRFSTAVAMFGSLLRSSPYLKNSDWSEVITIAESAIGTDEILQQEFINLVQQAKTLYTKTKRKRKETR